MKQMAAFLLALALILIGAGLPILGLLALLGFASMLVFARWSK